MVIHNRVNKIYTFSIFQVTFISLKFVGLWYNLATTTKISSRVTTVSSIMLFSYLTILQTHLLDTIPNKIFFKHVIFNFWTHIDTILYSTFDLNYIFYHQIYSYNCMNYVWLMFVNSLIFVIILKTSNIHVLFKTHILFPLHLSFYVHYIYLN